MLTLSELQADTILALGNEQSYVFDIGLEHFLALRFDNKLYIYQNLCPHLNKQLANSSFHCFDDSISLIECQFHSAQFNPATGVCVSGPCLGEKLKGFVVTEKEGVFYLQPPPP